MKYLGISFLRIYLKRVLKVYTSRDSKGKYIQRKPDTSHLRDAHFILKVPFKPDNLTLKILDNAEKSTFTKIMYILKYYRTCH